MITFMYKWDQMRMNDIYNTIQGWEQIIFTICEREQMILQYAHFQDWPINDQEMTKKWPRNDQEMTKKWQEMTKKWPRNDQEMTKKWLRNDQKWTGINGNYH
jgi:hypothetical protein